MTVERYSHVMHIVSTVVGELAARTARRTTCCAATFPAGTLSGAPKPRAMELIERARADPARASTAASVGYLDFAGDLDMAIAIRTAVIRDGRGLRPGRRRDRRRLGARSSSTRSRVNKAAAVLRAVATAAGLRAAVMAPADRQAHRPAARPARRGRAAGQRRPASGSRGSVRRPGARRQHAARHRLAGAPRGVLAAALVGAAAAVAAATVGRASCAGWRRPSSSSPAPLARR